MPDEQGPGDQYGFCKCGCGEKTRLANQTDRKRGTVKGEPIDFVYLHHARGVNNSQWRGGSSTAGPYVVVKAEGNPNANKRGYVKLHMLIAQKALGKALPPKAIVHHANCVKTDNRNNNLVICENQAYHMLLHSRKDAFDACGNADWMKCKLCGKYGDPSLMRRHRHLSSGHSDSFEHKACITLSNQRGHLRHKERRNAARRVGAKREAANG